MAPLEEREKRRAERKAAPKLAPAAMKPAPPAAKAATAAPKPAWATPNPAPAPATSAPAPGEKGKGSAGAREGDLRTEVGGKPVHSGLKRQGAAPQPSAGPKKRKNKKGAVDWSKEKLLK